MSVVCVFYIAFLPTWINDVQFKENTIICCNYGHLDSILCCYLRQYFTIFGLFTRCDKVVPGLGATNLLLLLLLLLPVSEFLTTFLTPFCQFWTTFLKTCDNFLKTFLTTFCQLIANFLQLFDNCWQFFENFLTPAILCDTALCDIFDGHLKDGRRHGMDNKFYLCLMFNYFQKKMKNLNYTPFSQ
jgi:hypothetical protein